MATTQQNSFSVSSPRVAVASAAPGARAADAGAPVASGRGSGLLFAWLVALWLVALVPTALLVLHALDLIDPTLIAGASAASASGPGAEPWQRAAIAGFWASLALLLNTALARRIVLHYRRDVQAEQARCTAVEAQRDDETSLIEHAPCGYHALDPAGRVLRMNQTELAWLGRPLEEVVGRPYTDFLSPDGAARHHEAREAAVAANGAAPAQDLEADLQRADGQSLPVLLRLTPAPPGTQAPVATVGVVVDFSRHREARAALERLTRVDPLTELGNRRDFFERAEREVARCRRLAAPLSLMLLDIDHFKRVNDERGHAAGDEVLRHFGHLCRQSLRSTDIAGRLGGEEFAVLMPGADVATAHHAAERLREAIAGDAAPCAEGPPIAYSVSVGIATLTPWAAGVRDLLRKADLALYEAKRSGRNRVQVETA